MNGIHFLRGSGSNCTCADCSVLYGGDCFTTPVNNMLDRVEERVIKFLTYTPTGRIKKNSNNHIDMAIEHAVKGPVCKFLKIKSDQFYEKYYCFLPLVFLLMSDRKSAKRMYRRARYCLFRSIEEEFKVK